MSSQYKLMGERRFLPFFLTQFLGAFNDNFFKNSLIVLVTFQATRLTTLDPGVLVNIAAGLFILPFLLFSATAGQLADKYEKSLLIRLTKILEICIALLGSLAFALDSLWLLLLVLFLMGSQSTMFGPVKYGILPQVLRESELIGGNALVESGSFISILLGTIAGGLVIALPDGEKWVSLGLFIVAILGYLFSRAIPEAAAVAPDLKICWNPVTETWRNIRFTAQNRAVFLSILGISWFWFYGAVFLSQFPSYARDVLGGDEHAVTLLLAIFSVGIGIGSIFCERLAAGKIELGLVPFGSIGLTLFAFDLWWISPLAGTASQLPLATLLGQGWLWRVLFDLLMIGVFGGFYIVPLYALVQQRSEPTHRSRVIAGNNILNALFMVVAAAMGAILISAGLSIAKIFLITALLNACVALYIYTLVPEFLLRFCVWLLIHSFYSLKTEGLEHVPTQGGGLLVLQRDSSYTEALLVLAACPRPLHFVIDDGIFRWPILSFVFRTSKAISHVESSDGAAYGLQTLEQIAAALSEGKLVAVFAGNEDGGLGGASTEAVVRLAEQSNMPIVPMRLQRLGAVKAAGKREKGFGRFLLRVSPAVSR